MNDLISRQSAIDAVEKLKDDNELVSVEQVVGLLRHLEGIDLDDDLK